MTDSPDAVAGSPDDSAKGSPDDPPESSAASPDDSAGSPDDSAASPEEDEAAPVRSAATDELWQELRVDPVKLALPGGVVGYTLRAYRPASEVTPTDVPLEPVEEDPFAARERARAEEEAALAAAAEEEALASIAEQRADGGTDRDGEPEPEPAGEEAEHESEAADEDGPDDAESAEDEDVPLFLSHQGRLLLFGSPEGLVSFLGSEEPHDLTQLDTWSTLVKRVRPADVAPTEEDTYELDLVVENLRGGHDAWDLPLLISAGEVARDLGFALRLSPVIAAMSSGSPLDDLDEALRAAAAGGFGGLFARRRLRRIGAQQASLGWRTVIGKIAAAVDWRD